jgi:hypothetical protein
MIIVECVKCGSNDLLKDGDFVVCAYCRARFVPQNGDFPASGAVIALHDDVEKLLSRCKAEPASRRRLANLILDIDPTNSEALQYLR